MSYRIADEPIPGPLEKVVTNPLFPLLGGMLGGFGVGAAWFVINAVGMGSATIKRELTILGIALAWVIVYTFFLERYIASPAATMTTAKFAVLGLQLAKLIALYVLQTMQSRSFALHQHFGGKVANGILPLVVVMFGREAILKPLPETLRWVLG